MSDTAFAPQCLQLYDFAGFEPLSYELLGRTFNVAATGEVFPQSPAAPISGAAQRGDNVGEDFELWDGTYGWQSPPSRYLGNSVRGKRTDLIYRAPMRNPRKANVPMQVVQDDAFGSFVIGDMLNMPEASPVSPFPAAMKYGVSITCPANVHDVDGVVTASWPVFGTSLPYRVYGGTNTAPTAIFTQPSYNYARINTTIHVSVIVNDVNFDDVTYVLKADGVAIKSGVVASGTSVEADFVASYATTSLTFTIEMTDVLGATSSNSRIIQVANVPPLAGAITSPADSRLREGVATMLSFDAGPCTWTIYDNGVQLLTGNATIGGSFKTPWYPAVGTHALVLRLSDIYGTEDVQGPTVSVVPWKDLNCA